MTEHGSVPPSPPLAEQIDAKAKRKLKARGARASVWFGLGMMGMVGWSVSVPVLIGVSLGAWLDRRYPGNHTWTLALLGAGLVMGCYNAWRWVDQEDRAMHRPVPDDEDGDHD